MSRPVGSCGLPETRDVGCLQQEPSLAFAHSLCCGRGRALWKKEHWSFTSQPSKRTQHKNRADAGGRGAPGPPLWQWLGPDNHDIQLMPQTCRTRQPFILKTRFHSEPNLILIPELRGKEGEEGLVGSGGGFPLRRNSRADSLCKHKLEVAHPGKN